MPNILRRFTEAGLVEFSRWLRASAAGRIPQDLLLDLTFSEPITETEDLDRAQFENRYEFGAQLVQLLQPLNSREISYDRKLWAWLAAWYFDLLCPQSADGTRRLRELSAYVPGEARKYYRHLVRAPWYLVSAHGEAAKFLLLSPLGEQSGLLDQLAARQFIIASPTLIGAAKRLYTDSRTARPRRGAGAEGPGSPRRFAVVANQLLLTFDIRAMPVDKFMALLPEEFGR
ncbi:MAG: DsbA family protein [Xanthobacteraceae bacterium]